MSSDKTVLSVQALEKRFGGNRAVAGVSFAIQRNSITALIGPNGAGKTTCFNCIAGSIKSDKGNVDFDGHQLRRLAPHEVFKLGLHRTFQLPSQFESMTVLENMLVPPAQQFGENIFNTLFLPRRIKRQEAAMVDIAMDKLALVDLADQHHERTDALSGGQRKLLDLARSLMDNPKMVLLDEPTAGVSPFLTEKIGQFMLWAKEQLGITFLMVSHDMASVRKICDSVIVMVNGKILVSGPTEAVMVDKSVADAYLGRV